jgi:hypothetical protein
LPSAAIRREAVRHYRHTRLRSPSLSPASTPPATTMSDEIVGHRPTCKRRKSLSLSSQMDGEPLNLHATISNERWLRRKAVGDSRIGLAADMKKATPKRVSL